MSTTPAQNTPMTIITNSIMGIKDDFEKTNNESLDFQIEARFALQIFEGNDFLQKTANSNPKSLKFALRNVSMVGLTLSPSLGLAYLVPRKGAICLDISYKGMITMLYKFGAVRNLSAELVYENDQFEYSPSEINPVKHKADPFSSNRGNVVGGYAKAVLSNGELLYAVMSIAELDGIMSRSESFKSGSSPWKTDKPEMYKKTLIRRLFKTIPKTFINPANQERIDTVMQLDQQSGEINFDAEKQERKGKLDDFLNDIPEAQVLPVEQPLNAI